MTVPKPLTIGLVSAYAMIADGGIQRHVIDLKSWLKSWGHQVFLLAPRLNDEQPLDSHTFFIGKAVLLYGEGTSLAVGLWPDESKRVRKILSSIPFDVLHFHSPTVSPTAWQIGALADCPIVVTFHEARENHYPWYNILRLPAAFLGHKVQKAIAVSQVCADTVAEYFDTEFTIIPNGIDTEKFSPAGPTLPWFDKSFFTILFLSRLEHRKGVLELISAYRQIKKKLPHARLVIAGQGVLEGEIRRQIKRKKLVDVILVGFVPEEEKASLLRSCQLFCAPASFGESFGIVLLEAMACGRPIVAASNSGYQEFLKDEKAGILIPPKDPQALAQVVINLAKNKTKRNQMAQAAVSRARQYDWRNLIPRIVNIYQEAIELKRVKRLKNDRQNLTNTVNSLWQQVVNRLDKE